MPRQSATKNSTMTTSNPNHTNIMPKSKTKTAPDPVNPGKNTSGKPDSSENGSNGNTSKEGLPQPLTPEDILGLRLPDSELKGGKGKVVSTELTVEKPPKDQYFQVHPDPEYSASFGLLEFKTTNSIYLVAPGEAMDWLTTENENCFVRATICLAVTWHDVPYLWPLKMGDNRWSTSARDIAEMAKSKWLMLQSNRQAGYYVARIAESQSKVPVWPDESFGSLLNKGFKNKIIRSMDHEAIKLLRGQQ